MSFTTPIYIPLIEGLDLSKDALLDGKDLQIAENIDWSVQGQARGRPSRAAAKQFSVRDPAGTPAAPAYLADSPFASTGFIANGLMRLRDGNGEHAMLGTDGRLFVYDSSDVWKDRGAFACFKVDQPHVYFTQPPTLVRTKVMGPDFGAFSAASGNEKTMSLLNPTTSAFQSRTTTSATPEVVGTMARCGTTTATLYRALGTNNLRIVLRANGASSLTDVQIATDAVGSGFVGNAPVICCDADQTVFFVVYQTTTANQYKVLRVNTSGTVLATYTGTLAGIWGHWVSNTTVAGNTVVVALTNADGLTLKSLNATTMADLAKDSTHGTVGCAAKEVVVGVESTTKAWWAYRQDTATVAGLRVGFSNPGTAASATLAKTYMSTDSVGGNLGVGIYTPLHQPVLFNGRMYLTLASANFASDVATWFTLDLSNLSAGGAGVFENPTLVARSRPDALALRGVNNFQPEGAVLASDGTGWTFASIEWVTYRTLFTGTTLGQQAVTVLNKISRSGPRCVLAGDATLFSGSVPRSLAGDQCYEAGFPSVRPIFQINPSAPASGGSLNGSYTLYVCWTYVDGAGQIHRSAASALTQATAGAGTYYDVYVQTPYFSERPAGEVKLEIYSTAANPAPGDPATLQATVNPDFTFGATKYQLLSVTPGGEELYQLKGEFAHVTPAGDGGIAAMGRRVWVADRGTVYASLLLNPHQGVAWNDEGSLSVNLPAGAGRILALDAMDDKLLVFCERGVWLVQDGGPDNVGAGPDIQFPVRISDLGCAGPRSTCPTDRGVVFCSPLDGTDPQRGGPWLLDRSLSLTDRKYLGSPAVAYFLNNSSGSWVPEVAFSPERQQLYVSVPVAGLPAANLYGDGGGTIGGTVGSVGGLTPGVLGPDMPGVVVIDFRAGKWSTWVHQINTGIFWTMDVIRGVLWTKGTEVAPYSGTPGTDADDGAYTMALATGHLFSDGRNGLGWARCRAISVLGSDESGAHDLAIRAIQDQTRVLTSGTISLPAVATSTSASTWPVARQSPEWRLPSQKCSTLKVHLTATPATARWSAIRLDVQPLPSRAPTSQRS